jgi:PRTRC genetic system protein E
MFKELAPLLKQRSFVLILTGLEDGNIRVNFVPKATDKDTSTDKALLTPLTITGEPSDLDSDLGAAIASYVATHLTIQQSVDSTKAAMKAAKEAEELAAKAKADAAKAKNKSGHVKPTTAVAPNLFDVATTPIEPAGAEAPLETDESEEEEK